MQSLRILDGAIDALAEYGYAGSSMQRIADVAGVDGRLVRFPRVLCALSTGDGRSGRGWIEWNLNEPRT